VVCAGFAAWAVEMLVDPSHETGIREFVPQQQHNFSKSLLHRWHADNSGLKTKVTVASVILHRGVCGAGMPPLAIAQDLQRQLQNPDSLLLHGVVTSTAVEVKVVTSVVEEGVPVYSLDPPPRTSSREGDRHKAQHGRLQPLQGEAHLDRTPSPDLPSPQTARPSPQPIASTARPPIARTSMTPERLAFVQAFQAPRPADSIQISADLVFPKGHGSAAGIVSHQPSEAGHARFSSPDTLMTAMVEAGPCKPSIERGETRRSCHGVDSVAARVGGEEEEEELYLRSSEGARRAHATASVPLTETSTSSEATTSVTTRSQAARRAYAWEFGL